MLNLPTRLPKRIALLGLSVFFVAAGVNHFANPDFYIQMMPPYLPAHRELVAVSGVLEMLGGVAVLLPRFRSAAGVGLALLLIAVFPANLHMALNADQFSSMSPVALYLRLPLQILLIAWARWATKSDTSAPAST